MKSVAPVRKASSLLSKSKSSFVPIRTNPSEIETEHKPVALDYQHPGNVYSNEEDMTDPV